MYKARPVCPFKAEPCFAYIHKNGSCKALENTNFHLWKGCPFYKSKDQYKAENGTKFCDIDEEEDTDD